MKLSLRHRLIVTNFFLLIVVTAVASVISIHELQRYYKARLFEQLKTRLNEVEYLLGTTALGFPYDQLAGYARAGGLRMTLIDASGKVTFDSNVPQDSLAFVENHLYRPEVQIALREGFGGDERLSATVQKRMFYAAKRINPTSTAVGSGKDSILADVGFIRLAMPLLEVENVLRFMRWRVFAGSGIALLLIALVSYWVASKLTAPIQKLARVAESVKKGDWEAHFERHSDDEIGELTDLLNDMLAKLRDDLKQMRKLETMRSQFLGNVSHELRTPIFAVQGYLETLLADNVKDEKVRKAFIEKAYRQAGRLNNLLTDLIDISRIESGEMKLSFRYFDLHKWLAKQVADLQATTQEYNVSLTLMKPETAGTISVRGDRERLRQVIANLVDNAVKYNLPGGKVEVGYRESGEGVEIFVADTGHGIAPEHLSRIFERFYRVDKERSRAVGGTGLGLAIVKHIVEAHDSQVVAQSELGKGSVFRFMLKKKQDTSSATSGV